MKRKIKVLAVLLFFIIISILGFQLYSTYQKKENQNDLLAQLPEFSLLSATGEVITDKDLKKGRWTVFVFFNSECHYCQEEAQQLRGQVEKISDTHFVWVSSEAGTTIADFENLYGLVDHPNITFLQDPNAEFTKRCNITGTPQFLIYDAEGNMVKNHKGAWRIDALLDNIANEFKTP